MGNFSSYQLPVRLKLVSPFLADMFSGPNMRVFNLKQIGNETMYEIKIQQWRWALKEAMDITGILGDSDVDYVRFPLHIKCPTICLYKRSLSRQDRGSNIFHTYQCFRAGSEISLTVTVLSELESSIASKLQIDSRPPTRDELIQCLRIIGRDIGISPWGSKFGYGKFELLNTDGY